eukprot:TRINITY_DN7785_c0_g1_i5.p1 TRINITY_DN7785_c0_g1~~TRINITY_DN7785_c0_g1_i5.p1  ORF type:complete len:308 (-),score=130.63 TRINITY_DN7785_c0_g1_i5:59-982(-)
MIQMKNFKQLEKTVTTKGVLQRYVDFALSLYALYSHTLDNNMLKIRITSLKNVIVDLIKRSAKELGNEMERLAYIINNMDFVVNCFYSVNLVFEEDLLNLEKELGAHIDKLVEICSKEHFGSLVDFVRRYAKEENESELKKLSLEENMNEINAGGAGGFGRADAGSANDYLHIKKDIKDANLAANAKLVENIIMEFSETWTKKIESFKNDSEKSFGGSKSFKQIVKKFLTNILAFYNTFFKYVKNNYPNLSSSMIPLHQIMKEIKGHLSKLNEKTFQKSWIRCISILIAHELHAKESWMSLLFNIIS